MKLYIYDHCPYCVKARMIFGLKGVNFDLITLANDDEKTPISMIGQKMVPILEKNDGKFMPESMDIVNYIDDNFGGEKLLSNVKNPEISAWLNNSREYIYKLAMPRWTQIGLDEFKTQSAVNYFTKKKEMMIGDFNENLKNSKNLIEKANQHLKQLNDIISSKNAANSELSEDDIHLFPNLRSLSAVKGVIFPKKVAEYAEEMSKKSQIPLHFDIAI